MNISFLHLYSSIVFDGAFGTVKNGYNKYKKSFLLNEGGYRDGKTSGTRGCIPHPYIFVQLLQDSEAREERHSYLYTPDSVSPASLSCNSCTKI